LNRPVPILFTIPNFITAGSGRAMLNIIERLDRQRFAPAVAVLRKGGDLDKVVEELGIPFIEAPFTVPPRPYLTLLPRCWRASRAFVRPPPSALRPPASVTTSSDLRPLSSVRIALPISGGLDSRSTVAAVSGHSSAPSSVFRPPSSVLGPPPSVLGPPSSRPFTLWHSFHYSDDYTEAVIARMAGARAWIYTKKNMGWGSRAWKLRTRLASRVAVQNSDMMKQFFPNGSAHAKTRSVPRGVDTTKFSPTAAPTLGLRAQRNIPGTAVVIACVAQLVPVKGHPTLLHALAPVPRAHLLIAGSPLDKAYTKALHNQVAELQLENRVHFLGGIKDVPALLAESDIFVLPTWARWRMEGCPVALLEAMSCGKACVATDIPGSRDLVENGKSGLLVPPEDSDALASALRRLLASPELRQRLGKAACQRVLDHFTIEKEVAAHEALYSELVTDRQEE